MSCTLTVFDVHDMGVVIGSLSLRLCVAVHRLLSKERIDDGGLSDIGVAHEKDLGLLPTLNLLRLRHFLALFHAPHYHRQNI